MTGQYNIYDTVTKNEKLSTLTKAIDAAGLADTLKGEGPFTLFAPTDEAFARLPQGRLDELLKPENKERLTSLLKFHIVPGRLMSNDVKDLKAPKTLQGQELKINAAGDDNVMVNDAKVLTAGVTASNGVIHMLDAVLMPQAAATAR